MTAFENVLTIFILLIIGIIGYCRYNHKTFPDFIREMKDVFWPKQEGGVQ